MKPPELYREFAKECAQLAEAGTMHEYRKVLLEMTTVWMQLAEEAETQAEKGTDSQ
jgi:hypothetical protein